MSNMNQYLVEFRPSANLEVDAQTVSAHRVEGWSNDYAFFGHQTRLGEPTLLIPRELVLRVRLTYDTKGNLT